MRRNQEEVADEDEENEKKDEEEDEEQEEKYRKKTGGFFLRRKPSNQLTAHSPSTELQNPNDLQGAGEYQSHQGNQMNNSIRALQKYPIHSFICGCECVVISKKKKLSAQIDLASAAERQRRIKAVPPAGAALQIRIYLLSPDKWTFS